MTTSLLIQFDQVIQAAIEAAMVTEGLRHPAATECVYLNRFEPVGENEPLPVIKLYSGEVKESQDVGHTISTHQRKFGVEIYVLCPLGHNVSVALDPIHQVVRRTILQAGRSVPGVVNLIAPLSCEAPEADSGIGRGGWVYTVNQVTYQQDLTATPFTT